MSASQSTKETRRAGLIVLVALSALAAGIAALAIAVELLRSVTG
jgi:hypothetical protein